MNREEIEQRRIEQGISKKRLCDACGINSTKYTKFISGEVYIFTSTLDKIVGFLNGTTKFEWK